MNISDFKNNIFSILSIILLVFIAVSPAFAAGKSDQNSSAGCRAAILTNEDFLPALLESIDEAQSEILMSVFSFKAGKHKNSYPDQIVSHLAKAVKRGVKVFVVLETTETKTDGLNIQNRKAGRLLEEKGINVFFDSPHKTTHTKLTLIDQRLIFLGSHNFTQSALKYNNEISVLLDRPELAGSVRNYILKIIKEGK
ncbi:MAG: phospholipase D-like domain-containing protein [Smithella sp.]|jgi:phosphatidylserine/phosphatidylglycerophosphate/cardiolipin synthase-like enzyme